MMCTCAHALIMCTRARALMMCTCARALMVCTFARALMMCTFARALMMCTFARAHVHICTCTYDVHMCTYDVHMCTIQVHMWTRGVHVFQHAYPKRVDCLLSWSVSRARLKHLACTSARAQFARFETEVALAVLQDAIVDNKYFWYHSDTRIGTWRESAHHKCTCTCAHLCALLKCSS